ncbi:MAG: hypothetical protein KTR14_02465 [Vampirovibrio sp.]|nr:hypothetical protein [Vampirovibrio sp.]
MSLVNCRQCNKPFNRQGNAKLCGECVGEEQAYFEEAFSRIGHAIRSIDFLRLARATGMSREVVRKTLLYRLGKTDIASLSGLKKGVCYVCDSAMLNVYSVEPLCVHCLRKIDAAVSQESQADVTESTSKEPLGPPVKSPISQSTQLKHPESSSDSNSARPSTASLSAATQATGYVTQNQFKVALAELDRLKERVHGLAEQFKQQSDSAEISIGLNNDSDTVNEEKNTAFDSLQEENSQDVGLPITGHQDAEEILNILSTDEQAIDDATLLQDVTSQLFSHGPKDSSYLAAQREKAYRRYGFKRSDQQAI